MIALLIQNGKIYKADGSRPDRRLTGSRPDVDQKSTKIELSIMIETPKDGRIQVEKLKYPVEVLAFKLWLDPELVSRIDLKRLYTCQLYASNSSKYVS